MKLFKILLLLSAVLLLQTMFLNRYPWIHLIDLFLLLNIYYALHHDELSSLGMSLGSGMVQDAFSQGILGLNAFSKTVVAYLISTISSRLMIKHPMLIMLLIGLATFLDLMMLQGLRLLFRLGVAPLGHEMILITCLMNMAVGILCFQVSDRLLAEKEYA